MPTAPVVVVASFVSRFMGTSRYGNTEASARCVCFKDKAYLMKRTFETEKKVV